MNRRNFLKTTSLIGAGFLLDAALLGNTFAKSNKFMPPESSGEFEIIKTRAEWQNILNEAQFAILREEETERAFSSPLNDEKRKGVFHCAGCDLPVYSSDTKYDSGTGWPSFYQEIPDAVRTKDDSSFFMTRTEVHCRRCGGHFGHVFEDGPLPTGLRHCINGLALKFIPA